MQPNNLQIKNGNYHDIISVHSGLILQDLTFINVGNQDFLTDGNVNFAKRWQEFNILDSMRRFKNWYCHFCLLHCLRGEILNVWVF